MPSNVPDIKVVATQALGCSVELAGESLEEAQQHAEVRGWLGE
jgi:threonine dehydratase